MARRRGSEHDLSVGLVCLGCAKNLVDGERLLGFLGEEGFPLSIDPDGADVVLVNTCGFIGPAVTESLNVLAEQIGRRDQGDCAAVVALGCLPSRSGPQGLPAGLDGVFGIGDLAGIRAFLEGLEEGRQAKRRRRAPGPPSGPLRNEGGRLRLTPRHWAYVKVTEGCSNRCRYCTIPSIRGPLQCKSLAAIRRESEELVASGARELVLIGQDTAAWRGNGGGLEKVLETVARVEGVEWIRVLYAHPAHVDDALVEGLAMGPPVVPYLDLPIQHASGPVLESMGRRTSPDRLRALVERLRSSIPGLVLRTTVMVGYPGEGESDFEALLEFLQWGRFERLGAFPYSPEDGTEAALLPGRPAEAVTAERFARVLALAASLRDAHHRARVGRVEDAVAEWPEEGGTAARTAAEAPEVDPMVWIAGDAQAGRRLRVRITGLRGPDLVADRVAP